MLTGIVSKISLPPEQVFMKSKNEVFPTCSDMLYFHFFSTDMFKHYGIGGDPKKEPHPMYMTSSMDYGYV